MKNCACFENFFDERTFNLIPGIESLDSSPSRWDWNDGDEERGRKKQREREKKRERVGMYE